MADDLAQGKEAFASGAYPTAIKLLGRVSEEPGRCEASFYLGLSHYRLKQLDQAIVALEVAASCPECPAEVAIALGQAYLEKGDDNRAAASLQRGLSRDPNNIDALRSLSSLFLRHEMNEQAIPLLERLTAARTSDPQAHADLGAAYAGVMNLPAARRQFELALQLQSDHAGALLGLSNVHLKSEDAESALPLLDRAIATGAKTYETYYLRGVVHARAKRYEPARADLLKAIELGGADPELYFQLSRVYQSLGDSAKSQEALARFKDLRTTAEQRTEALRQSARLTQEARALVQRGELIRAAETLERARALQIADPQLHYRLASLYLDLNRLPQAAERGRAAVELAPGDWRYRYLLGVVESKRGDLASAREHLEIAARLNGSAAEVQNALGDLLMRERKYAQAARYFAAAVRLKPDEPAYRSNLEAAKQLLQ